VRPEPDGDEVFVLAGREVDEAVDTAADADDALILQVLDQELG